MAGKGISFISKQTGIREFYSVAELQDKTFADVAERLYSRLLRETKTIPALMEKRDNIINQEHRAGLVKFFYLWNNQERPISKAESVIRFYLNTGTSEVLFFVDVIGGQEHVVINARERKAMSAKAAEEYSHYQFLAHAKQVLADATTHGNWLLKEYEPNRFRLVKTIRDRYRRVLTVVVQANTGYPMRPPRVLTIPKHTDPCFSRRGELDWTIAKDSGRFTWELYVEHSNPLVYLMDELRTKYGLVF